jgi:uncharacterized protein DUF4956
LKEGTGDDMAVNFVERPRGLEFRAHPDITERERARPRAVPTGSQPASAATKAATDRTRTTGLVIATVGLIAAIAALSIAALYAAGRGRPLPFTAEPLARLALAAAIGITVTAVHKRVRGNRTLGHSLARAETLLCVAGALTMILIDNSVARAFGIAGAASIVRFRTPVDDPTDATVLFLLMALGMASGVGSFGLALAGAAGVCVLLLAFGTLAPEPRRRTVTIELVGSGHEFPSAHVQQVFAKYGVVTEPAEWLQDTATRVKYRASVDEALSLEALGAELMSKGEAALQSVAWEIRKNGN